MNKYIQILLVSVFVLCMCLLLSFYFDTSNLSVALIIGLGLLGGLLSRFFIGYVIPNKILFRSRFIIYGIGFGIMIGLVIFITTSAKEQSFEIQNLLICLLISIPLGIIVNGTMSCLRFRKLKKRTNVNIESQDSISDFATYSDSEYISVRGLLLLSNNKLSFYSATNGDCIFEMALKDVNPIIRNSKFMSIPNGFSWNNKMNSVNVAFPHYWTKLLERE